MKDFKRSGGFRKPSFDRGPRRDFSAGPKEMFDATCSHCGKRCEVPFRPNGKKPVYCRDCFNTNRTDQGGEQRSFAPRSEARPEPRFEQKPEAQGPNLRTQIDTLNQKLDKLTRMVETLTQNQAKKEEAPVAAPKKVVKKAAKK